MATEPSLTIEPTDSEVACPKCGHLNAEGARRCSRCSRHLLVFCYACGRECLRSSPTCPHCRTDLHLKHIRPVVHLCRPLPIGRIGTVALLCTVPIAAYLIVRCPDLFIATSN